MRGCVTERILAVRIVERQDLQRAILRQGGTQVADRAVDPAHTRRLIQSHAEGLGNVHCGDAAVEFLYDAALQSYLNHIDRLLCSYAYLAYIIKIPHPISGMK